MNGVSVSSSVGRIVPGEMDIVFMPRIPLPNARPVFLFHGQLRTAQDWWDTVGWMGSSKLAYTLAEKGFVVISAYWSGPLWGNTTFRADVDAAQTYASQLGATADKFVVVGASMGSFECLSLAQHSPDEVVCGVCTIPAVNLDYFRDTNTANARAYINTAWGMPAGSTSATDPLPADANPFNDENAALITAPFRFYGSAQDPTAPWSDALLMAGKINAVAESVSDQGHTDATIGAAPLDDISAFVLANAS